MKERFTLCLIAFSFLFLSSSLAQNGAVSGKVLDPQGQPVIFANILLNHSVDSSLVKVEVTDDNGEFTMRNIPQGRYQLKVSYVGFSPYESEPFALESGQNFTAPVIRLSESAVDLATVEVTAERPLLELQPDKMVFNVDGSINAAGSNALELLRKSPGVVIDNNDNITVLGRSGVQIYIDGKPSPLGAEDLAQFLRTVQSSEIDAIEIITNPSSKYDAEGNAGIINIRMKKDKSLGANANLNLGYSVGEVAQYNTSISGNYRNKQVNLFGSFSYNDGQNRNFFNIYRQQVGLLFDSRSLANGNWNSQNFKAGADFFLNKKHTIGILANGYVSDFLWASDSRTPISMIGQPAIDSILVANSRNDGNRNNLNFNVNYRFDNGKGNTWNMDVDYGFFRNNSDEFQPNVYKDATESEILQERINRTLAPTDIDIYTFKVDHERNLLGGKLGAGAKGSLVKTDNDFQFFDIRNGNPVLNIDRSNLFEYTENVNAAYVNFSRQIKKFGINLGIRMEHTHSTGDLTSAKPTDNDSVERDYVDFFPSGGITYSPSQKHSFRLNYSRRINRPSYQDLNPFVSQLDELTFEQGNPFLQPEYANSIQLTHTFNYRLNTTLSYSHTQDLITRITDTSGVKASYITWLNLADQYNYSLNLSAPISIKEWWSTYTSVTGSYTKNEADYGDGKLVDLSAKTFNIYSQHTFRLPNDFSFEVSGWYNSPSLWGGTFEMESMWNVDAGVQKKILDGRGNLKLSVSDIFKTTNWHGVSEFGALFIDVSGGWDSRRFRANFTYLLGNTQVKGARNRKTGLEDEQNRIKTEN